MSGRCFKCETLTNLNAKITLKLRRIILPLTAAMSAPELILMCRKISRKLQMMACNLASVVVVPCHSSKCIDSKFITNINSHDIEIIKVMHYVILF